MSSGIVGGSSVIETVGDREGGEEEEEKSRGIREISVPSAEEIAIPRGVNFEGEEGVGSSRKRISQGRDEGVDGGSGEERTREGIEEGGVE